MKNSPGRAGLVAIALGVTTPIFAADVGITIPKGTVLEVVLENALSSRTARVGDPFHAPLVRALFIDGELVLPETTVVEGRVVAATSPGGSTRSGFLSLRFVYLTPPGAAKLAIDAKLTSTRRDPGSRSAASMTPVATAGAEGPAVTSPRSAAGTTDVELSAGTILSMEFEEALVVPRRPRGTATEGGQP